MRLLSKILIGCLVLGSFAVNAQSSLDNVVGERFFSQNPITKAAILAAMDDDIIERVDKVTGETYFLRREVHPWTQEVSFYLVVFDAKLERFIVPDPSLATVQDPVKEGLGNNTEGRAKQDSCRLKTPQHNQAPRPRRSSTIKIAEEF